MPSAKDNKVRNTSAEIRQVRNEVETPLPKFGKCEMNPKHLCRNSAKVKRSQNAFAEIRQVRNEVKTPLPKFGK